MNHTMVQIIQERGATLFRMVFNHCGCLCFSLAYRVGGVQKRISCHAVASSMSHANCSSRCSAQIWVCEDLNKYLDHHREVSSARVHHHFLASCPIRHHRHVARCCVTDCMPCAWNHHRFIMLPEKS